MGLSAIDVTPGRLCGEDDHLFAGGDPGVTNYLALLSALSSRLLRCFPWKKFTTLFKMMFIATILLFGVAYSWPQKYESYRGTGPGPDGKYTLEAPGIRAKFIPYGASISNLFINDTNGLSSSQTLIPFTLTSGRR